MTRRLADCVNLSAEEQRDLVLMIIASLQTPLRFEEIQQMSMAASEIQLDLQKASSHAKKWGILLELFHARQLVVSSSIPFDPRSGVPPPL